MKSPMDIASAKRFLRSPGAVAKDAGPVSAPAVLSSIDVEARTATFVMSDPTVDHVGDVLDPTGARLETFMRNPQFLWMHDQGQLPIGKWKRVWVEGGKLMGEAWFAPAEIDAGGDETKSFSEACWRMVNAGMLNAVSVSFIIHDAEFNGDGLDVTDWELLECSLVTVPMNPSALLDGKAFDALSQFRGALEARMSDAAKTEAKPEEKPTTKKISFTIEVDSAKADEAISVLERKVKNLGANLVKKDEGEDDDVGDMSESFASAVKSLNELHGAMAKTVADHAKMMTSHCSLMEKHSKAVESHEAHAKALADAVKALSESDDDADVGDEADGEKSAEVAASKSESDGKSAETLDPVSQWLRSFSDPKSGLAEAIKSEVARATGRLD